MSLLHAYFHLRKQNEFQRCLEQSKAALSNAGASQLTSGSGGSAPTGRSWTKLSSIPSAPVDINAQDWLGRTVLHLACSATDPAALEFARLLLAHPQIQVNSYDQESHWTPLHRALYAGNIAVAVLLLQRSDTDMFLKDYEGYTPFDLYNSTVNGTNPPTIITGRPTAELYTWGSNRNATLGLGDSDDRTLPEQVVIRRPEGQRTNNLHESLKTVSVADISMSKLHTVVITTEAKANIRSCGFASSGRLGPGATTSSHTQFSLLSPQGSFPHAITAVALGQDHTLALTSAGEVLSWGLNRFSQLGYVIEAKSRAQEDQIQASPRKITGPLRNQVVVGVACCKTASACWTATQLFTWGTNGGQLGYEKTAQPQVLPRLVACVSEPVLGVAMTDTTMLVLLQSHDVLCLNDGTYWKLPFITQRPQRAYMPPSKEKTEIRKVTASESSVGSFALVSKDGDVYLLNTDEAHRPKKEAGKDGASRRPTPQLVWAVRKQFTAVKDVALGSDGSMILCTKSGHVFVRTRVLRAGLSTTGSGLLNPPKNAQLFKFHRIPNLQRIFRVCANSTGAFAALRLDAVPDKIPTTSQKSPDDFALTQPFWSILQSLSVSGTKAGDGDRAREDVIEHATPLITPTPDDEDSGDIDIAPDIRAAMDMCSFLQLAGNVRCSEVPKSQGPRLWVHLGADIVFRVGDFDIPVHQTMLSSRVPSLDSVLAGSQLQCFLDSDRRRIFSLQAKTSNNRPQIISVQGFSPITILLFCYFIYTDRVVAIWDRRVALAISDRFCHLGINTNMVAIELESLARSLQLETLASAAKSAGRVTPPPSLCKDLKQLLEKTKQPGYKGNDVVLILEDRRVNVHSVVLRARSLYFSTFFNEESWTSRRVGSGVIEVDLKQFKHRPMSYLLRYFYEDASAELFHDLDFIQTIDQLIDFMFEVISCSNHLLSDRFTDICSSCILRYVELSNVASILVEASHFNAIALVHSLHGYMAKNLETLMEMRALEDLPQDVLKAFTAFVRKRQADAHPYIRNGGNLVLLTKRHESWLAEQDIPVPFIPTYLSSSSRFTHHHIDARETDRYTQPTSPQRINAPKSGITHTEDDLFPMDGDSHTPKASTSPSSPTHLPTASTASRAWRSTQVHEKTDMRSIMEAEQLASVASRQQQQQGRPLLSGSNPAKWTGGAKEKSVVGGLGPSNSPSDRHVIERGTRGNTTVGPSQSKPSSTPPRPGTSPWSTPSMANQATPSAQPILRRPSGEPPFPNRASPLTSKGISSSPEHPLGPLITPTKAKPAAPSAMRRSSSETAAWASPKPTVESSSAGRNVSFAAIQEQQAANAAPKGPPKSLREIQEEEQEIAFLTWFEEESARIQAQEAASMQAALAKESPTNVQGKRDRKSGGNRQGKGRGRGGGGGGGRGRGGDRTDTETRHPRSIPTHVQ
ncbi:hypothetical protein CPB86DRAFT_761016 [Serendipita vermifera]|nr:hypothetical protein CPB86DRAFT_761016 [Serendipita vermifera]